MFTFLRWIALAGLALAAAEGQNRLSPRSLMHITLPEDSPVAVVSADWGESVATPRGGAMLLDLHTSLTLRNVSNRRIRGVTLLVLAQEVTPGGKASVSVPSIDVGPGEAFPVRMDVRLLRPQADTEGPLVEIGLDGVLFEDLSFYGPNRLNSRRSMTLWELEARRDRRYLKNVLETEGPEAVRRHLVDVQARLAERPKLDVQVSRGRTTAAEPSQYQVRLSFLRLPGEPVTARRGVATVSPTEAQAPQIFVRNQSSRPVRYLEIGWVLESQEGEEFYAGSVPAEVQLLPGQETRIYQDASLKLSHRGRPVPITGMLGFVNHIEFADGESWIPEREALNQSKLKKLLHPSAEEQRLADLYRRKGLGAVVAELRKY